LVIVVSISVSGLALVISETHTMNLMASLDTANQRLQHLASHDTLTQLPNRVLLEDRLDKMVQFAARNRTRFSLFFLDLDGFKAVNDAYGHTIGDLLLAQVADRLIGSVRQSDTIARVGGDEFVFLAAGVSDPANVSDLALKIVKLISEPFWV